MVNEEHLRPMVKMAMFDKNEGNACRPMIQYARADYVSMQMLRSFFSGSIAFLIFFALWALYDIERLLGMFTAELFMNFVITIGIRYAVFVIFYLVITYFIYQQRYTQGRRKIKKYYVNLKTLNKIYAWEEKIKSPVQKEQNDKEWVEKW